LDLDLTVHISLHYLESVDFGQVHGRSVHAQEEGG